MLTFLLNAIKDKGVLNKINNSIQELRLLESQFNKSMN